MVNIIGEFKSVRANNIQAVAEGERHNDKAIDNEGQTGPKAAVGGTTGVTTNVRTVPPAVTKAELFEERLGNAMLKEALHNPLIPNPEKWAKVAEILGVVATTIRTDLQMLKLNLRSAVIRPTAYQFEISERRDKLEEMAELGITRAEAASRLGVSEATIRRDLMVMRLKWDEEK